MTGPTIAGTPTTIFGLANSISQGGPYCCPPGECDTSLEFSVAGPKINGSDATPLGDCGTVSFLGCQPCEDFSEWTAILGNGGIDLAGNCVFQSATLNESCNPRPTFPGCDIHPVRAVFNLSYFLRGDCLKNADSAVELTLTIIYEVDQPGGGTAFISSNAVWGADIPYVIGSGDTFSLPYVEGTIPVSTSPPVTNGFNCYLDSTDPISVEVL